VSVFQRFPEQLQHAISSHLGFSSLRPVQELAGEAILDGKNTVVLAPTAGGKTEASMFPVIGGLLADPPSGVGAIYVAPIKALLNNQEVRLGDYTQMVGLNRFVWHGDASQSAKKQFVAHPTELLMTTPESLEVMLMSPRVPVSRIFKSLRWVVIDEVHAFAGTDRGAHLMSVLERLTLLSEHDVQRIGLSATVGNPDQIARWITGSSKRLPAVVDPPRPPGKRQIKILLRPDIADFAREAARETKGKKSLFFCQSRSLSENVADKMRDESIDVFVHHGSVSKEERHAAEERFAQGTNACIVCTSTLELGIDVGGLDLTFQANAPSTVSSFLQRMGRTGRREDTVANMTFMCEHTESLVQNIALVLLAQERWVESVPTDNRCWPVLVHQLLALTHEHGGIGLERCWQTLCKVPDFSGISRQEFDALVAHMLAEDFLFEAGGLLSMGQKAEKTFGKKNFMELYAVFSSPVLYRVMTQSDQDLGSLEQNFVDRLVEEMSTFLLGGRAWMALRVDHQNRVVRVQPAPRGKKPSWGGFVPQFLGYEICQKMKQVLIDDADYPFVDQAGKDALAEWRNDLGNLLRSASNGLRQEDSVVRWWTFAGGRINQTLKYALEWKQGWKVIADNFSLRIEGNGISQAAVEEQIAAFRVPGFWTAEETQQKLMAKVPQYRLSKFQQALPERWQTEMVGGYLLGFAATEKALAG
jgi:ATP-dependent helicase Lhr and Lhr-like helicase